MIRQWQNNLNIWQIFFFDVFCITFERRQRSKNFLWTKCNFDCNLYNYHQRFSLSKYRCWVVSICNWLSARLTLIQSLYSDRAPLCRLAAQGRNCPALVFSLAPALPAEFRSVSMNRTARFHVRCHRHNLSYSRWEFNIQQVSQVEITVRVNGDREHCKVKHSYWTMLRRSLRTQPFLSI